MGPTCAEEGVTACPDEDSGKAEKRQVTLGKQNFQFAEILSGLDEGDKVLIEEKAITGLPVITSPPGPPPSSSGGGPPGSPH